MFGITLSTILGTILSSTVISGIITALFNMMQHNNTNSLKYITEERQKWREKIRDIAKNIEAYQYSSDDKDKQKLKEILVELKVNINPYGKGKDTAYMEDGHIWAMIEKLEGIQETQDKDEFSRDKNKLIDYLSYLLKYDWERAKYEVEKKSHWILWLKVCCACIILTVFVGIIFPINIQSKLDNIYNIIVFLVVTILTIKMLHCFTICIWIKMFEDRSKKTLMGDYIINMFIKFPIFYIIYLCVIIGMNQCFTKIESNDKLISKIQDNWKTTMDLSYLELIGIAAIVYFVSACLFYMKYNTTEDIEKNRYIKHL